MPNRLTANLILAVQSVVWRRPYAFFAYGLLKGHRGIFNDDYDLLIDGYPRSGNTFAAKMIQVSQSSTFRIRSHKHCPAYVLAAIQIGKPIVVLIRDPIESAVSYHLYSGRRLEFIIRQWCLYYEILRNYRHRFHLLRFADLTHSFSSSLSEIENQFHLGFSCRIDEEGYRNRVADLIEHQHVSPDGQIDELKVNLPHPVREDLKEKTVARISSCATLRNLAVRAGHIYSDFVSLCSVEAKTTSRK